MIVEFTGKSVADSIENQLAVARSVTPGAIHDAHIVLNALEVYTQITAYGLDMSDVKATMRHIAQHGVPKQ